MGQLKNLSTTVRLTVANPSSENKSAFGPGIAKLCLGDGAHGSTLTEDGNRLLDAYLAIEEHLSAEADRLFKEMTR